MEKSSQCNTEYLFVEVSTLFHLVLFTHCHQILSCCKSYLLIYFYATCHLNLCVLSFKIFFFVDALHMKVPRQRSLSFLHVPVI